MFTLHERPAGESTRPAPAACRGTSCLSLAALVLLFAAHGASVARAADAALPLFDAAASSGALLPTAAAAPGVVHVKRQRAVEPAWPSLRSLDSSESAHVRLNLFPDADLVAELRVVERSGAGSFSARGALADVPHGYVLLIVRQEIVVGKIAAPGIGTFEIRPLADGRLVVRELDDTSGEGRSCGMVAEHANRRPESGAANSGSSGERGGGSCDSVTTLRGYAADPANQADMMVYYNNAALTAAGGVSQIEALIDLAVLDANTAYTSSQINMQITVVRKALIAYNEVPDAVTNLDRLALPNDGFLDQVYPERDQYGADLVSLWVGNTISAGGVAYYPWQLWPNDNGQSGFSVMREDNATLLTLAHEVGHNFGCQHDRLTNPTGGWYPFSYGYREPGNVWKTIMAYPPGTTVPYFSNPNLNYSGPLGNPGPLGVPGENPASSCDNARTHNLNAFTIANFRPSTVTPTPPSRIYVRKTAPPGGNGSSWGTALREVQDGINLAVRARGAVSEVWVAAATYKPDAGTNDRERHFRPVEGVTIYGGFAGTESLLSQRNIAANPTFLSGDIGVPLDPSDNCYHVVRMEDVGPTAVMDGFIIREGSANGGFYPFNHGAGLLGVCTGGVFRNCRFQDNVSAYVGGGGHINSSNPQFVDCVFEFNNAQYGGALDVFESDATFLRCRFEANEAVWGGGGLHLYTADATVTDTDFVGNFADYGGGLVSFSGGAVLNGCTFDGNEARVGGGGDVSGAGERRFDGCTYTDNTSTWGAAMSIGGAGVTTTFESCDFLGNHATDNGAPGTGLGAVIVTTDVDATIRNCRFSGNTAGFGPGGLGVFDASATVERCTFENNQAWYGAAAWNDNNPLAVYRYCGFYGNEATFGGGGMHNAAMADNVFLEGCVFSGNRAPQNVGGGVWNANDSHPTLIHCTFAGNSAGFGGPAIFDTDSGVRLQNSIVWNGVNGIAGSNNNPTATYTDVQGGMAGLGNKNVNPLFVDANGADNVVGTPDDNLALSAGTGCIDAANNSFSNLGITLDFAGNPRFVDDPGTPNTGQADARPVSDMGAYEYQPPALDGDMNCDGAVTVSDIGGFVLALTNPSAYAIQFPTCSINNADVNDDSAITVSDIGPFVALLTGG